MKGNDWFLWADSLNLFSMHILLDRNDPLEGSCSWMDSGVMFWMCVVSGNGETIPAGCASGHVGRRRTDLMPTIPTRDSSAPTRKPFTKSPGRTYSLSRLDQLAKPRKPLPIVQEKPSEPKQSSSNVKSMSRSMGHLAGRFVVAACGRASPPQRPLRKADSKSMHQLSVAAPVPPPRTTRAVLLRKRAIESPPEGKQTLFINQITIRHYFVICIYKMQAALSQTFLSFNYSLLLLHIVQIPY